MPDLADYAESLSARFLVTDETATRPTTWYLALYSTAPSDAGGGVEISAGGYSRQEVAFTEGETGTATNDADLTFTASEAWGGIAGVGLFDASTSGNLLLWKALDPTVNIADGQSLIIRAGDLTVRFD
jgi:hypothetical protein